MYRYGLIGNCQASALISEQGSVDWLCFPRPDSPPVFGKLLDDDGGHFSISPIDRATSTQNYVTSTNVLETIHTMEDGSAFKVTDFFPRFSHQGTIVRPMTLLRLVEPLSGSPALQVSCQPVNGWEKRILTPELGDQLLHFQRGGDVLRLRTNMPLTYLQNGAPFHLKQPLSFALTWNHTWNETFPDTVYQQLDRTLDYWNTWVRHCAIPTLYQSETIRSALALKLHCYEDTGAILAALTTSLPEEPHGTRNWDYRFCWLRDAYFCLSAFRNLGHFEEMEGFLKFLLDVAHTHDPLHRLHPVYRLDNTLPLPELEHTNWGGFADGRPVRSGNQAAEHTQNDVYGEMVLTLAPIFFDERIRSLRTRDHEKLVERLVQLCVDNISKPDAGLWELRNGWQEHSFSNLLCWAGIDRAERIQQRGYLQGISGLSIARKQAESSIRNAVKNGVLQNGPTDATLDSALLLLPMLNFPDSALSKATVENIWKDLSFGDGKNSPFLFRYLRTDDFGKPKSPFLICSFWLVQALAKTGRREEARAVMESLMTASNSLGLFAEHFLPQTRTQWGNFPQAYSHVGLINAAFAISPEWDQIL